jgi:fructuronate reductase
MNDALTAIGRSCSGEAHTDVMAFLALDAVFAPLSADAHFVASLYAAYTALGDGSAPATARTLA